MRVAKSWVGLTALFISNIVSADQVPAPSLSSQNTSLPTRANSESEGPVWTRPSSSVGLGGLFSPCGNLDVFDAFKPECWDTRTSPPPESPTLKLAPLVHWDRFPIYNPEMLDRFGRPGVRVMWMDWVDLTVSADQHLRVSVRGVHEDCAVRAGDGSHATVYARLKSQLSDTGVLVELGWLPQKFDAPFVWSSLTADIPAPPRGGVWNYINIGARATC
jgi:hypothetical protein